MAQESEVKVPSKYQNTETMKALESLVDDSLQLFELNSEEDTTIAEVCDTIGMMLTQMKTTVSISPSLVAPSNAVKSAILAQNVQVTMMYRDDEVEYKKLMDFRPSTLIAILNDLIPKLKEAGIQYRKNLEGRLSFERAANKKMKKIEKVYGEQGKISMEDVSDKESRYTA